MSECIKVRMHVCILHVQLYILCTHINTHTNTCIHSLTYTHTHTRMHTYTHTCTKTLPVCVCVFVSWLGQRSKLAAVVYNMEDPLS